MHRFTFNDSRYKEIRNKSILRDVAVYASIFLIYFIKWNATDGFTFKGGLDSDSNVIALLYIAFTAWINNRRRKDYNAIQIVIDDTSITHIEPGKDDATLLFKHIKSITQNKQGLFIQSIYPATSLKVLAQMQGYNQIGELLSVVKPIKNTGIFNRSFLLNIGWIATIFLAIIFKDFIFDSIWLINAIFAVGIVGISVRFYHLQTSPYVNKDDKWASYGLIVIAILLLAILLARIATVF